VKFFVYQEVVCRQIGEDYLAYSDLTSETISLSYFAYATLNYLITEPMNHSKLLALLEKFFNEGGNDRVSMELKVTLNKLIEHGVIYQSSEVC